MASPAVITFATELDSKVHPLRILKCGPLDGHNHIVNSIPHFYTGVENVKGLGNEGTIRQVTFTDGHKYPSFKTHHDVLDINNYVFQFNLLEGGLVGTKLSTATYTLTMTPTEEGCHAKICGQLTPLPGVEITAHDVEDDKNFIVYMYTSVVMFLEKNPDAHA